jgi:hypothetical protein
MTAFPFIRALGIEARPVPLPTRLSDRTGDAITHHLTDCGLWNFSMGLELERDGDKLGVRIFMPESGQNYRDLSRIEAVEVKEATLTALQQNGHRVRFSDVIWSERGRRGWEVIVKAQGASEC